MIGWIKLHRKIQDHWLWEDPVKFQWWIKILLEANFTQGKMPLGNQLFTVDRGCSSKSIRTWARQFDCCTKTAKSFFDLLESEGMITRKILGEGKHRSTHIKITNYEEYQGGNETQSDTQDPT